MFQRGSNHQPVVEFLFSEMLLAHADHESQQEGVSWCKLNWSNRSILMKDCQCRQACSEQMIRYKFPIFQFQPHFVYSSIMLHHVTSQYISSSIDFQIATRGLWFLILNSLDIPKTWYSSAGIFPPRWPSAEEKGPGPQISASTQVCSAWHVLDHTHLRILACRYPLFMTNSSPWKMMAHRNRFDFPSDRNLHLFLGFSHGYVK